ncbi:MAG: OmpA/MotB family protein, partial [Planctomycetaceae bacterium]
RTDTMAGKGGGAWKVAYADFVTAMMAFFMVMWLTNQKPATKEALGSYFRDPWAKTRLNSNETRTPTIRETKAGETDPGKKYMGSNPKLEPHDQPESPESKQTRITTVHASERTANGTIVDFAEASYELNEAGKKKLRELLPNIVGLSYKLEIRGHASQRELHLAGNSSAGWDGCYKRSMAVLRYLRELGIDEARIRLCQASGYEPLSIESEAAGRSKNVRVEVFMLNETVESLQGTPDERSSRRVENVKNQAPVDEAHRNQSSL